MNDHHQGILWEIGAAAGGLFTWILHNIQAIDAVLQAILLCVSIVGALIGLRKVLR